MLRRLSANVFGLIVASLVIGGLYLGFLSGKSVCMALSPQETGHSVPTYPPPPPLDRESDVREPIFRDLLKHLKGTKGDRPCFISFGWKDGKSLDPPDDYFKSLADLKLTLKKASECERSVRGVRDPKTGKAGVVYTVSISKTISDTEVVLDAGWFSAGLAGGGYSVRMVKKGKIWIPQEVFRHWAS